ncbi:permease prefix domain 1-containing protein [Nocardiopsis ganjiahuensis]|uniref:permease prefix domain 1-containing protein n=1 Tax=Nocardiopsis ganjiahuensis TaxID=239984 RepID=UPI00034879E5|nr:permease prefix domain 1-containing protein [Nocardiopsis ganjiahuensis]
MSDQRTGSTLTDRYVWSVTRHLGPDTGPDVARELRGTVLDAVEAKVEAGTDPDRAEKEALTELGDPDVLAAQYGEKPRYLVGPGLYPGYVRLLRALLAILVPLVLVLLFAEQFVSGPDGFGDIALQSVAAAIGVTVHVGFWVTLAYAFVERTRPADRQGEPLVAWDTGQLPEETPWRQVSLPSTVVHVLLMGVVIALLSWQFTGVSDPATQVQVLDPDLALPWTVLLVGLLAVEIVVAVLVWRVGHWTPALAVVSVLANASWATVAVWLLVQDQLITADLPERFGAVFDLPADWSVPTLPLAAAVIAVSAWEIGSCLNRTRQAALRA